jgi:hypothetical protein
MSSPSTQMPYRGGSNKGSLGEASCTVAVASVGSVELPMLTRSNNHDWSLVMRMSLEALGLWDAMLVDKAEQRDDMLALTAILRGVPAEMKAGLASRKRPGRRGRPSRWSGWATSVSRRQMHRNLWSSRPSHMSPVRALMTSCYGSMESSVNSGSWVRRWRTSAWLGSSCA